MDVRFYNKGSQGRPQRPRVAKVFQELFSELSAGGKAGGLLEQIPVHFNVLAGAGANFSAPGDTQRVQSKRIFCGHFIGVEHDLIGVVDKAIQPDTPRFVPNDALAMLACGPSVVPVAVVARA
jgi:hypothetical protein